MKIKMPGVLPIAALLVVGLKGFVATLLLTLALGAMDVEAGVACGDNNQRACCIGIFEYATGGGSCNPGHVEVKGCSGDCRCFGNSVILSSGTCKKYKECGGPGQRACCAVVESGPACDVGLVEVPGCSGNCLCGGLGTGQKSLGTCQAPSACGGDGQRACCIALAEFSSTGLSCNIGNVEVPGCSGDCLCGGPIATGQNSSGTCRAYTSCGGDGQRACCVGVAEVSNAGTSCNSGTVEVAGCQGNCLCGGLLATGQNASGTCRAYTPCGGPGQRACCAVVESGPACSSGLVEVSGCSGNCLCGGAGTGQKSLGTCQAPSACGGVGERACCIGTLEYATGGGSCDPELIEAPGCNGDCLCGGPTATGQLSTGTCYAPTPATSCGGEGERACCGSTLEGAACEGGLVEALTCSGSDCVCGGFNPLNLFASGICLAPTSCGGLGERACCTGTLEYAAGGLTCETGLIYVDGCSGDCQCGGPTAIGDVRSLGTCTAIEPVGEPNIGWTGPDSSSGLRGYADLHFHLLGHMAHGGATLVGSPYDPVGGFNNALRPDYGTFETLVAGDGAPLPVLGDGLPPECPLIFPDCGTTLLHGDHTLFDDPVGFGNGDDAIANFGTPSMHGWPTWKSATHQQAYHIWLERAWRGGLRLTVLQLSTNEALCKALAGARRPDVDCEDSMASIKAQRDEAFALQKFIEQQRGGWLRIVKSPQEARDVIGQGKLAVVLGIEVDNLYGCKVGQCNEEDVTAQVNAWYAEDIRHVYPIHNFDNAYGGTAIWSDAVHAGNRVSEGQWYTARECTDEGYNFKLDNMAAGWLSILGFFNFEFPAPYGQVATCNELGLTPLGEHLVKELMRRNMIIDLDHMSVLAFDDTMNLAEAEGYPGVTGSHVLPFDMFDASLRSERMWKMGQLQRINELGGMVAVMTNGGERGADLVLPYGLKVDNDCRMSTKSFAQVWQYVTDVMGGPVALGTDFNGTFFHFAPRFGSEGCTGVVEQRAAQERSSERLRYPFNLDDFGTFDQQVSGQRTYDYNVHGLAHVGLMPDFIADMEVVGLSGDDLEPLWQSAEGYILMWEAAKTAGCEDGALCSDDTDEDGVYDIEDNCIEIPNSDQADGDGDGYGNLCDGDFNNDGVINFIDLGIMKSTFFTQDPEADMNGDGIVNFIDLGLLKSLFFTAPGPSCCAP